jgi:hypothetical protein
LRFAALQPVYDAVIDRWGQLGPDVARGLGLRHDLGAATPLGPLHRLPGLAGQGGHGRGRPLARLRYRSRSCAAARPDWPLVTHPVRSPPPGRARSS